ncbi:uncharacterized protein A4U43_UnF4190 [Asparagus officinalis]|uniref:Uncharacterized protein n=1 Tax=Asparagus officinalis TaxID=4686 RepID=A0A1R3L6Z1_ASPOF|nr:uncharacterized protein A4U43_UnF4190 [Asparagus officinalis]
MSTYEEWSKKSEVLVRGRIFYNADLFVASSALQQFGVAPYSKPVGCIQSECSRVGSLTRRQTQQTILAQETPRVIRLGTLSSMRVWVPTFSFDPSQPTMFVLPVAFCGGKLLLEIHDEVPRSEYYDARSEVFDPVICFARDLTFFNEQKCGFHVSDERSLDSLVPITGTKS